MAYRGIIVPRMIGIGEPTTSSQVTSGSTISFSHTVESQLNNFLIVVVTYCSVASTVSSITYNGVGLTFSLSQTLSILGRDPSAEIWYLKNPTIGANTLTVNYGGTFSGAEPGRAVAINIWNVNSSAPSASGTTGTATSSSNSVGPNNADTFFIDTVFVNNTDTQTAPDPQTIFSTYTMDNSVSVTTFTLSYRRGVRSNNTSTSLDRTWTNSAAYSNLLAAVAAT